MQARAHWFHTAATQVFDLRGLTSAAQIANAPRLGRNLGGEVDLTFSKNVYNYATLSGGYTIYFNVKNSSIGAIKNVQNPRTVQNWFWLMISFKPEFLRVKY